MPVRDLLHRNDLVPFKEWLNRRGICTRPGKGDWEVLQVLLLSDHGRWFKVYDRLRGDHFTVDRELGRYVRHFIKEKKACTNQPS